MHVAGPARLQGFDDVLYLDARELRYVTETSGANFFVVNRAGQVITPPLDDQILAGVTRDSVLTIAREELGLDVQERPISIDDVLADAREAFCTGTAWTLKSVGEIAFRDRVGPAAGARGPQSPVGDHRRDPDRPPPGPSRLDPDPA